ncbi:transcriptional regulator [Salmonella enterica subsp. houtenae]|nr:transcriptional regulator [Salmonella enterica subsp. houtenae]
MKQDKTGSTKTGGMMKLAILNNSGNVGKSTIAQLLLLPRISESVLIRIESINDDGNPTGEKMTADDFDAAMNKVFEVDDAIIDVGSSNIEKFYEKSSDEFAGSHIFIDYYLIPVTPEEKQQKDTVSTIITLLNMGVDEGKIKLIFNKVNKKKDFNQQFDTILNSCPVEIQNKPVIYNSELFNTLQKAGLTYEKVSQDTRDFDALIKASTDKKEQAELRFHYLYRMAYNSFNKNLDEAFIALNLE